MNELIKEASGKTMDQTLQLVLDKGKQVIRYDTGAAVLFQPDETYIMLGRRGQTGLRAFEGALAKVRNGQPVLRSLMAKDEHMYSGLQPEIRGRKGQRGAGTNPWQRRESSGRCALGEGADRLHGLTFGPRRAGPMARCRAGELAHPTGGDRERRPGSTPR